MSIIDDTFALIFSSTRQFGTIVPDVVIRELNRDEMVITDHPVERGAAISDHAFIRPLEVEMQLGWSDSTGGYAGYCEDVYQEVVALQKRREPFDLSTGKRRYKNMLVSSISVQTDEKTENALMMSARFREVIIVDTQTTSAPKSAQASPEKTSPTTQSGTQQLRVGPTGRVVGGV